MNKTNKTESKLLLFFEFEVISVGFAHAASNKRGNNHVISVDLSAKGRHTRSG